MSPAHFEDNHFPGIRDEPDWCVTMYPWTGEDYLPWEEWHLKTLKNRPAEGHWLFWNIGANLEDIIESKTGWHI